MLLFVLVLAVASIFMFGRAWWRWAKTRTISRTALIAGAAGIIVIGAAWMFRYDASPAAASSNMTVVLDRWTGAVSMCNLNGCKQVNAQS